MTDKGMRAGETGDCDILIIGGGVNGCGIARDAAGRGYRVVLAEMNDLASGTSSAATKLIHGGLRYLEHYEFRLVRESLMERERLWKIAPHIIWPLRFVLPHHPGLRPAWLLRLGLFLYDHLGGRKLLPPARRLDLGGDPAGLPLKPIFGEGFEYSDAWVQDARLVVLNAMDARARGAEILTRTRVTRLRRRGGLFEAELAGPGGEVRIVTARLAVNAAGPWVDRVIGEVAGEASAHNVRLVQGSHIVVPRLYDHDRAYIFQNADGRIVFAIPYEEDFTLIGTTDRDFSGDPAEARIGGEEMDYLCRVASDYFKNPVRREDIVWSYTGVRPLFDDHATAAQEATRDYVLRQEGGGADAVRIDIFGGKLTTYRRLAEAVLARIGAALGPRGREWTGSAPLPGGDFPVDGFEALVARLGEHAPGVEAATLRRLARHYGTRAFAILKDGDTGRVLAEGGLGENELRYLMREEWALTADDLLWRRTKLGLRVGEAGRQAVAAFMEREEREHERLHSGD